MIRKAGRPLTRKTPVGVVIENATTGSTASAARGARTVTVVRGLPSEVDAVRLRPPGAGPGRADRPRDRRGPAHHLLRRLTGSSSRLLGPIRGPGMRSESGWRRDPRLVPMSDYLELLPAVDIADGQAVQLVQGVAGSEKHFGDPVEAALNWQRRGAEWIHLVDLDAAFGRGHNRDLLAKIVGHARHRRRDERGHPGRRVAGRGDGGRLPPGQHRHRRARAAGVVRARHRRVRRPGRRRARRARPDPGCPRLDPRRWRPVRRARPARRRGLRPLRRHRRQQGRHAPGPQPRPAPRGLRRHRPSGGRLRRHHRARRPRGAAGAGRRRGRGRDHRHRALRGPLHPRGRARADPPR